MSFDTFLQRFEQDEYTPLGYPEVLKALRDFNSKPIEEPDDSFFQLETSDGCADIYGVAAGSQSLMFNHVEGRRAWDAIWAIADTTGAVIMPPGVAVMATTEEALLHIPEGLCSPKPVIVEDGTAIIETIENS